MALWGLKVIPPSTSDPRSAILFICLHCAPGVPLRPAFRLRGRLKSRDGSREGALGRMARRERRASPAALPVPTFRYSPPPPRRAVRREQRGQTAQSTLAFGGAGCPHCALGLSLSLQFWLGRRCSSVTDRRGGGGEKWGTAYGRAGGYAPSSRLAQAKNPRHATLAYFLDALLKPAFGRSVR